MISDIHAARDTALAAVAAATTPDDVERFAAGVDAILARHR